MLNNARSHGLWGRTAPEAPHTTTLQYAHKHDVAIVGAGYTGLSAALHLAEAGAKAAVLEASEIGFGASGRNVGLVNAGLWMKPDDVNLSLGEPFGERLLELLGRGPKEVWSIIDKHRIDCDAVRNGTLHCAPNEAGLVEISERELQWRNRGAAVRLLNAKETSARVGTKAYLGSLLDLRAGTIQPLAYARGLARAAIAAGAKVYTSSAVTRFERSKSNWIVHTSSGSIEARWIVVATDAYTSGPWDDIRREQIQIPYFNVATRPLPQKLLESILPNREGCWDTKKILTSFRLDDEGRLICGSIGALRGGGAEIHSAWARRTLIKLFPQLSDVQFEAGWYGMIGTTSNHLPRFHQFAPNVVSVCGYSGRGISPGTVFGRVLADHILGRVGELDLPLPITTPEKVAMRALKEIYYEFGAQLAHVVDARV
ncbi:FAD-binding oxidoreductase [Mesorhizobium sp. M4B.F.Ca.ET.190.01.1.1]|uniref:NAD(P)/FAD-dependent oxidoreductase n=1 Tax=unclassified Mesorhizobium TaxID=325217 RepID=UPI0010925D5C|nr:MULTISPECIES: FAD-binding oxidoreductase [unclassified Mesorhizobium]TGR15135.1 FAD-binding oxidoreductase [Mesorhizobium sp. M4B.F.Ca.ET.200.01.1.1]TGS23009.1 FAD-binding oxidoreductase [Mesorhizobium sp. M4B.F.Ca.ET.190.01.1.1]TGT33845.1 FAD-binding oxidoreductase [Mesorhizobium sp. M4B.F.Ca.ET.172.01.1.1]